MMADLDAYVVPSFGGSNLLATNLTGHPAVVVPDGFRADGTPTSITFQGRLFGEAPLLALAHAYQRATDFHQRHPDLEAAALRRAEAEAEEAREAAEGAEGA
jgi:Asp-tRNA(Asn)/Glu-tRNA(Gln) amidotransferase A subunit family amidase